MRILEARDAYVIAPRTYSRPGKIRHALLLWLLGAPIPVILLFFLIRAWVV